MPPVELPALDYGDVGSDSDSERASSDSETDKSFTSRSNALAEDSDPKPREETIVDPLVASRKLAFVERCFIDDSVNTFVDEISMLRSCAEAALSEREFRDACAERARGTTSGTRCGWPMCRSNASNASSNASVSKVFDIDGTARTVRETSWTRSFCSKACVHAAEAFGRRLAQGRALSAEEGAARAGVGYLDEAKVMKSTVKEREVTRSTRETFVAPKTRSEAMASAAAVDGYVPRTARKAIEEEKNREKKIAKTQAQKNLSTIDRSTSVTWNETEIQAIEQEAAERKTTSVDEPAGVFYFDTYAEGHKNAGEKGFVPSIGGRFSEGQLRTEPRTAADEATKAMEKLLLEADASVEYAPTSVAEPEDVAEVTRKMLASALTSKPIPGYADSDEDEDEDIGMSGTSDSEGSVDLSSSAPQISQFGVTWMAVDNLVTDATFALVDGDGAFVDILPLRNRYTVSVSEAWNESLAKVVPSLCLTLDISGEKRRIEQNLTTLLRTFAFERPAPEFSRARWMMMALLFIEMLIDADLLSKEMLGKAVAEGAKMIFADAEATKEEVTLLRQRLRGEGVRD